MKKITVTILAFLYMAVSSGIAIEIHYCMGKKAGVELYGSDSNKCGKCGMEDKKGGCCHDEHKFYKIQDSHKSVSNNINFAADEVALVNDHNIYDRHFNNLVASIATGDHSPPVHTSPSACILNCVFRL